MLDIAQTAPFHVSTVCVCLGFDGESFQLLVLDRCFIKEDGGTLQVFGLPGRIVGKFENVEDAAERVLATYSKEVKPKLRQFQVFGEADRCQKNIISALTGVKSVERLLCVAYVAMIKTPSDMKSNREEVNCEWYPINKLPNLCFDHEEVVREALVFLKKSLKSAPEFVYDLLNTEFTVAELRRLIEAIIGKKLDIRNFYKKLEARPYLVSTNKKQVNVAHRAARFYRFDRKIYKKRFENSY